MKQVKYTFVALTLSLLAIASTARAHFVWIEANRAKDGYDVRAGFGHHGDWDAELADRIAKTKYTLVTADGKESPLAMPIDKEKGDFAADVTAEKPVAVFGILDYGVLDRGQGGPFLLRYYSKAMMGSPRAWKDVKAPKSQALDIVPSFSRSGPAVTVMLDGKPYADAEVHLYGPKDLEEELKTDAEGKVALKVTEPGNYGIRVGRNIDKKGTFDGKAYDSIHEYATMTFSRRARSGAGGHRHGGKATAKAAKIDSPYDPMPFGVTSFGADYADGAVYVFGGHRGEVHDYSSDTQSDKLLRLKVDPKAKWEELASARKLQSPQLVAASGKLYRIGGMSARNKADEDSNLWSVSDFACFDPKTGKWEDLPELPEPRSSHGAAVLGDKIYVAGGWTMKGDGDHEWVDDILAYDLSGKTEGWKKIAKQPFKRRALTAVAKDGKLYVIGGLQDERGLSSDANILDLKSGEWTTGPAIPGEGINAFSSSAAVSGDDLFLSVRSGELFRLSKAGDKWELVKRQPTARMAHQLVPAGPGKLMLLGGINRDIGKIRDVEVISVTPGGDVSASK
ncbi:N-acetylneuraminate epimerase precursor [Planctomycetes bacterium Pan216]|uniref:N-acetylneuraminate epimerase n=1 Tax=Kolteria novifilia TaxID=2527975 RepID=A0A518BCR0_9BACT|nr:N-acetylneuraminate epimerase precursor [Planctomycetes bacterium Pan216]